jgi:predicted O-linked N-acetylglucosamine transferase (SPINDLY family)
MGLEISQQMDLLNRALACRTHGHLDDLTRICLELLRSSPECADAWYLLGVAASDRHHTQQSEAYLSRAIAIDGDNPNYRNALGVAFIESRQYQQAETALRQALRGNPHVADLHCNLGRALMLQERFTEALACFRKSLETDPAHAVALANMAVAYQSCGLLPQAVECYHRALRIDARCSKWWANLGAAQLGLAAYAAAAISFHHALEGTPDHPAATKGLAVACCALGQYEESGQLLARFLSACPDDTEATVNLAVVYQHTGQWEALRQLLPRLDRQTREALDRQAVPSEQPLFNISRSADPALNLAVARAWSRSIARRARHMAPAFEHPSGRRSSDRRIAVGYLSADFRSHAVAHQAVALFEQHDRAKFRVCGFSVGPQENDEYRRRIAAACDPFVDLSTASARDAAQAIYDCGVDILVDLMGHTHQNRLDICALRPAPIQVSYLGFLASSGAEFIDYMVGDPIVTPPEHAPYYSEKIIRLPHCYQIISPTAPTRVPCTRRQAHLPENGFVFCCFNQAYKIEPEIFACWMDILKSVPSAVLWLYRANDKAAESIQAEAERLGVRRERLIFADKVPLADHLNRLRLADLALDTPLYNGGATTANALAAGVPLVTTLGKHFVSRMSASHLEALGLRALVATDLRHYAYLAVSLARSPQQLQSFRQALRDAKETSPMFDAACFTRDLERAYSAVWSRYAMGRPPEHLVIPSDRPTKDNIKPHIPESISR